MNKTIGKVIDVFIPEQSKKGSVLDVMDRTNIGFIVKTSNEILTILGEQNDNNSMIMKNDIVSITKQNIDGKEFIDLELYEGDYNE